MTLLGYHRQRSRSHVPPGALAYTPLAAKARCGIQEVKGVFHV